MAWQAEFIEGFDKYGPTGLLNAQGGSQTLSSLLTSGEWTELDATISVANNTGFVSALSNTGQALRLSTGSASSGTYSLKKTLPGNYARVIGGMTVSSSLGNTSGFVYVDGTIAQLSVCIETTGRLSIREGNTTATILAQSATSISAGVAHVIEWDLTFSTSTSGSYTIYLDGTSILTGSSVKTAYGTSNSYANAEYLEMQVFGSGWIVDHHYLRMFTSGGSGDTALLDNPVVETQFPISDSSVQFTPQAYTLGQNYSTTGTTNSPGSNQLVLRPFTPPVNMTLNSISILPETTNGTANFKAAVYTNSAGVPNTLLSSGSQVTGVTSGTVLTLTLTSSQSLTGGTQYWLGYITDTSIALSQVDNTTNTGQKASNTYASGAPATAPTMTAGQPSFNIWGNCTSPANNYTEENQNPPMGIGTYISDNTVGHTDLYGYPALTAGSTNIATVAVKAYCTKSDAGARTINLNIKSGATTGQGGTTAITPPASFGWVSSYFDTDPNTSSAWANAAAVNSATSGPSINS